MQTKTKKPIEYAPPKLGGGFPFPIDDVPLTTRQCYRGNILVRSPHVSLSLTDEQAFEYARCAEDPVYFIKTYCRITSVDDGIIPFEVFGYQEDIIRAFYDNRFTVCAIHRQAGKCHTFSTLINTKNARTGKEYRIPAGIFHKFISDQKNGRPTEDIGQFELRKDLSREAWGQK